MRVLKKDLTDGYMKIKIDSEEDLWHLDHVIKPGDKLKKRTKRTTIEGREKKSCVLELEVEKIDYQGHRLRTTGEIINAPEDVEHGYHTFNLEPGEVFDIWKDWRKWELKRVNKAVKSRKYKVLVCLIDKEGSSFHLITEKGISDLGALDSEIPGKMYKSDKKPEEFYGEVLEVLKREEDLEKIIIAGSGFEKENLYDFIEKREPSLAEDVMLQDTSVTGSTGLQEVIKRGGIEKILKESRISEEVNAVENLLKEINKDTGKAAYGEEEVQKAVEMGAVKKLLVIEEKTKDLEVEELMEKTEQRDGEVQLIHSDHEAGEKLNGLGGIAAVLRYSIK